MYLSSVNRPIQARSRHLRSRRALFHQCHVCACHSRSVERGACGEAGQPRSPASLTSPGPDRKRPHFPYPDPGGRLSAVKKQQQEVRSMSLSRHFQLMIPKTLQWSAHLDTNFDYIVLLFTHGIPNHHSNTRQNLGPVKAAAVGFHWPAPAPSPPSAPA
jgi:hypothetical protein